MTYPLLEGVRVLELALLMPADQVAANLADLGADVIKVEQPPLGDYVRDLGGILGPGISELHLFHNRNKRSLAINLRTEEGQKVFHQLVKTADVVYESGTPGSKIKLKADYESCRKVNPNIVYASFNPYGNKGPYSHMPSHGWGVSAFANSSPIERMPDGRLRVAKTGPRGGQTDPGPWIASLAIVAAVVRKLKTSQGAHLDIGMTDALIYTQHSQAFKLLNPQYPVGLDHFQPAGPQGGTSNPIRFNYYECKDGKVLAFQATELKFWQNFCRVVNRPDWLPKEPWPITVDIGVNEPEIEKELIALFKTKTLKEWIKVLGDADIPVTAGYTLPEVLQDEHVHVRQLIQQYDHPGFGPVKTLGFPMLMDGAEFKIRRPAPWGGKDNVEILTELGLSKKEIQELKDKQIIGEDRRLFDKAKEKAKK